MSEIQKWLPNRKATMLGAAKRDAGCDPSAADIIILNYEIFEKNTAMLELRKPVAVVCDEAQYLKTYDSKRTKAVKEFLEEVTPYYRIMLTGTPVMNRPSELLTLLTLLPLALSALGGFYFVAARYCRATLVKQSQFTPFWNYSGSGNLDELNLRLQQTVFIRREKHQVLSILPKTIDKIEVEISNRQEYKQANTEFAEWLKTQNKTNKVQPKTPSDEDDRIDLTAELGALYGCEDLQFDSDARYDALRQLGALRQLTGDGKVQAAVTWINEHLSVKDEKLVVFAFHKEVQKKLAQYFPGCLTIAGEQTDGARAATIKAFQTKPEKKLIICSIKCAQTAVTLHAGRHVLFVELDWTPASLEQAEDRVHRIGQNEQVVITYLIASATMDDRMMTLLANKRGIVSVIASGEKYKYGHKKNGVARLQLPGPGRPGLGEDERKRRRKASKSAWQAKNSEYMRDYMQRRRSSVKDRKQD